MRAGVQSTVVNVQRPVRPRPQPDLCVAGRLAVDDAAGDGRELVGSGDDTTRLVTRGDVKYGDL